MDQRDACECCGVEAVFQNCYPYGTYCGPCGDDICHPTGYGHCFVENDRAHRNRRPADFVPHEEGL